MGESSPLSAPNRDRRGGDSRLAVQLPFLPPSGHSTAESRPEHTAVF